MSFAAALPLPTLVAAVCAAFALAGCGVSIDLGGDLSERTETETVGAAGIDRPHVAMEDGRIAVSGAATDAISVTALLGESDHGDGVRTDPASGRTVTAASDNVSIDVRYGR